LIDNFAKIFHIQRATFLFEKAQLNSAAHSHTYCAAESQAGSSVYGPSGEYPVISHFAGLPHPHLHSNFVIATP
jgi:hypothetical protein